MTGRSRGHRAPATADVWVPLEEMVSRDIFKAEAADWERRIGVEPKEIHMRPMRRKWGSCSTSGRVTFNEQLLTESAAFQNADDGLEHTEP